MTQKSTESFQSATEQITAAATTPEPVAVECDSTVNESLPQTDDDKKQSTTSPENQNKDLFILIKHKLMRNINILQV